MDRRRLAGISAKRQDDSKRVTAFKACALRHVSIFKNSYLDRLTLTDVPEHLAYDTVTPFRFCAPPPPGLLKYCDITYPVSLFIVLTLTLSLTVSYHEDDSPCTFLGSH